MKTYWTLLLFFFIMVIGLIHSENIGNALKNIETKLSLFFLPMAFAVSNLNYNTIKPKVFKGFIEGLVVAILFGITNIIYHYLESGEASIVYSKLSYFGHNSYLSLYLNFGLILLLSTLLFKKPFLVISKFWMTVLVITFSIIVLILASKAGILSLFFLFFSLFSFWSIKSKKYVKSASILIFFTGGFFSFYSISDDFKSRINELAFTSEVYSGNSGNLRISSWKNSLSIIKKNPWIGVGTGDAQDCLDEAHLKKGNLTLYKKHLNAHNQFLQTGMAMGIIGLFGLIIFFFVPFFQALKKKNIVVTFLLVLLIFNMLFESMLEKQEGVIFIAFFTSLLYIKPQKLKPNQNN